jgi:LacI family transcriptional regulator
MTTIKDVARLAGTSTATVSRFMNSSGYVKESTVERIKKAIEDLNYEPNHRHAKDFSNSTKSKLIALIIPDIRNPFFSELLHAIQEKARNEKYNVICCNSNNDILKISRYFTELKGSVDGIIIAGEISSYHIDELSKNEIPVIVIDANTEDTSVHSISTNNRLGGKLATLHLIEQGYQRVAHLRGPLGTSTAEDRFQGYIDALNEKGVPYDPVLIQIGDFQSESGYEAMIRFLALSIPPDAVFVANDLMALGALEAINQKSLQVPNDIGIIGYDNIPLTNVIVPKLSTIQQPVSEIGIKAIESILRYINQPDEKIIKERLDPILKIRNTSIKKKGSANYE